MHEPRDHAVQELTRTTLTLRDDLIFTPHEHTGRIVYHIEDPLTSKFYSVGLPEYTFISLLDGKTSIGEALRLTVAVLGKDAFSVQEASTICSWLIGANLARSSESSQTNHLLGAVESAEKRRLAERLNPLFIKWPLCNPDRFFTRLYPWFGWTQSPLVMLLGLIVGLAAVSAVATHWSRFSAASVGVLAPGNWIWLGVAWVLLKLLHESSHALACKRYGGTVREIGVAFILFAPIAYVDVTSSWRFRSKWHRIHTAAAGMYGELWIAAISAIAWTHTPAGAINHLLFNIVLMASVATALFNANPLMRFDGYYMLSDWLEIPNLYSQGRRFVSSLAKRYFFGIEPALSSDSAGRRVFIGCYGLLSWVWRLVVCSGLVIAASTLFHGAGIVIAALAVVAWLSAPVVRIIKWRRAGELGAQVRPIRFVLATSLLLGLVGFVLFGMSSPLMKRAPGVVEFEPLAVVRTDSGGFVHKVNVESGQFVENGQILVQLVNDELEVELGQLELALEQSKLKGRIHSRKQELALYQVELENQAALRKRRDEKRRQFAKLTIRAPIRGRVLSRNLRSLAGLYVAEGTELLSIGNEQRKELQISIGQQDVERFTAQLNQPVKVRIRGRAAFSARLVRVEPRAGIKPLHMSLCAPNGGPLAVRATETPDKPDEAFEFIEPRFSGFVTIPNKLGRTVRAGQAGSVALRAESESVGVSLYHALSRWFAKRLLQAESRGS